MNPDQDKSQLVTLHAKAEIEAFARQRPQVHLFELGDLDDAFWPYTLWYGWRQDNAIHQLALVYTALATPILIANADPPHEQMRDFLRTLLPLLPRRFYAHLDPSVLDVLLETYQADPRGLHWKMGLTNPSRIALVDTTQVVLLTTADLVELTALYAAAYPDTNFHARELQTGRYYGIRRGTTLISAAGVHIYSPTYQIAALGNVATHPAFRGRGLSTQVCARLCQALGADGITEIGLNVRGDNVAAIACYTRLGFSKVFEFGAYMLDLNC